MKNIPRSIIPTAEISDLPNGHLDLSPESFGNIDYSASIDALAAEKNVLEQHLAQERTYNKQLQNYIQQVLAQFRDIPDPVSTLKEVNELKRRLSKNEEELDKYRIVWPDVLQREKEARTILEAHAQTQKRIADLESKYLSVKDEFLSERAKREALQGELSRIQSDLNKSNHQIQILEASLATKNREIEAFQALRETHQSQIEELKRSQADAIRTSLEAQSADLRNQHQIQLDQLTTRLSQERAQLLTSHQMDLAKNEDLIQSLSTSLRESNTELLKKKAAQGRLERELQEKQTRLGDLEREIENLRSQAQIQAQSQSQGRAETQREIMALENQLESLRRTMELTRAENSDLKRVLTQEFRVPVIDADSLTEIQH